MNVLNSFRHISTGYGEVSRDIRELEKAKMQMESVPYFAPKPVAYGSLGEPYVYERTSEGDALIN